MISIPKEMSLIRLDSKFYNLEIIILQFIRKIHVNIKDYKIKDTKNRNLGFSYPNKEVESYKQLVAHQKIIEIIQLKYRSKKEIMYF